MWDSLLLHRSVCSPPLLKGWCGRGRQDIVRRQHTCSKLCHSFPPVMAVMFALGGTKILPPAGQSESSVL